MFVADAFSYAFVGDVALGLCVRHSSVSTQLLYFILPNQICFPIKTPQYLQVEWPSVRSVSSLKLCRRLATPPPPPLRAPHPRSRPIPSIYTRVLQKRCTIILLLKGPCSKSSTDDFHERGSTLFFYALIIVF